MHGCMGHESNRITCAYVEISRGTGFRSSFSSFRNLKVWTSLDLAVSSSFIQGAFITSNASAQGPSSADAPGGKPLNSRTRLGTKSRVQPRSRLCHLGNQGPTVVLDLVPNFFNERE